jgi:hypothetical protein
VQEKERELEDLRRELGRRESDVGSERTKLEGKYREQQLELDRLRELLAAAGPKIHLIEPKLIALRGERGIQVARTVGSRRRASLVHNQLPRRKGPKR